MSRVLLCTDGSAYGQVCAAYAAWYAGRAGLPVDLLYVTDLRQFELPFVVDVGGALGIQPYQAALAQLQDLEKQKAVVILENARRALVAAGFGGEARVHHETGLLVDRLADAERGAALVCLGKRGENVNFATGHLGSTMERVVRAATRPCLVTSRAFREIRRVLVAYDGSAGARRALEWLTGDAAMRGLELDVVSVADERGGDAAGTALKEAVGAARAAGFSPRGFLLSGLPEDVIAEHVAREGVDLVAMGAYGHSRIRHLLIGSTTTELLRRCLVPVALVR